MNRGFLPAEMLHCTDVKVLERQRARLKWQQEQLQRQLQLQQQRQEEGSPCFDDLGSVFQVQHGGGLLGEVVTRAAAAAAKPDPGLVDKNGWSDFPGFGPCGYGSNTNGSGFEMDFAISRTYSCPSAVAVAAAAAAEASAATKGRESIVSEKLSSAVGGENLKKRKVDKMQNNTKVVAEDDGRDKRINGFAEDGESKITEKNNNKSSSSNSNSKKNSNNNSSSSNNKENSGETSKNNSKVTDVQKPDYIHVRARRGQATDSHSLAERVRREKISERMKYLQDLVPGCNKITGKAGMLDEIINYVQSLQRQVEFLSMKLAAVNPRLDFNMDNLIAKEAFPMCATNFPAIGMSSDMINPAYLQFNPVQQQQLLVSCSGLDMAINPSDMALRRSISAPVSTPGMLLDTPCFTQMQTPSTWDADLQNLYNLAFDQGRSSASFPSQPFTGSIGASNLKMEM